MYEVITLSHTADIQLKIRANSLEELFLACLEVMGNILKIDFCSSATSFKLSRYLEINAPDTTVLLIDFLSEVLTLSHAEKIIFCKLKMTHLDDFNLKAFVYGVKVDSFDEDIKAVTYHEAEVKQLEGGQWQTHIIFDI